MAPLAALQFSVTLWCATLAMVKLVGAAGALAEIPALGVAPALAGELVLLPVGLTARTT